MSSFWELEWIHSDYGLKPSMTVIFIRLTWCCHIDLARIVLKIVLLVYIIDSYLKH